MARHQQGREDPRATKPKPHATGKIKPGDVSERVGVEAIRSRGVNVEQFLEKLIDAAGAEYTRYYYYTILRKQKKTGGSSF